MVCWNLVGMKKNIHLNEAFLVKLLEMKMPSLNGKLLVSVGFYWCRMVLSIAYIYTHMKEMVEMGME